MVRDSRLFSPTISLVLASAFWGVATVISKVSLGSFQPSTLLVIQLGSSVLVLWPAVFVTGVHVPPWRPLVPLMLLGALDPALSYTLSLLGLNRTSVSLYTLLWAIEPALIAGLAWMLLRETLRPRLLIALAFAIIGVILINVGGSPVSRAELDGAIGGNLLVLGGVLCGTVFTVVARRFATTIDPLLMVALQQTSGLLCSTAIWALLSSKSGTKQLITLSAKDVAWAALSGVMYYSFAYWLFFSGLGRVRAGVAGASMSLIPVFGIATAYVFLNERLTLIQWVGATTILLSVFVLFLKDSKR